MDVEFLLSAEKEFEEAVYYYNSQSEGLGFEFAVEVRRTIQRIMDYPKAWPKISKRTRRCRTNRFPYGLIYQIRRDCILVVAIMHMHRKPESWQSRIEER
jgi:plasmid stabilization system protein ParE